MIIPAPQFDHLERLTDGGGLYEHAEFTAPRRDHAYCVDDVARGLLVLAREPRIPPKLFGVAADYLNFVVLAQTDDGRFHNRRSLDLSFADEPTLEDCWGRALWGLGTAAARIPALAASALEAFNRSASQRSVWPRAMAFAGLGAAEVLAAFPGHVLARSLLADAVDAIGRPEGDPHWRWPELRLRYANAALAETLLAGGVLLGNGRAARDGLAMLEWLMEVQTTDGHLSLTPARGWSYGERRPGFDQQPIEAAALADACARAWDLTGDARWSDGVHLAAAWFLGANDVGVPLFDADSWGGCDGLHPAGRNENQGAESTLAMLSTFQQAQRVPAASVISAR